MADAAARTARQVTIEHIPEDPKNPIFFPTRTKLDGDSITPANLTFTLGTLVGNGPGARYTTDMVRLWFEFSQGAVSRYPGAKKAQYERPNAQGGNAVGIRIERKLLRQILNVPRLKPIARVVAKEILGWQEGSIDKVYSITVMASP